MTTTAKFPAAALADFGADTADLVTAVLSGSHNASVTTITLTATAPASWPTAGWVTIDGEIIKYTGKAGSTLTGCTRGDQSAYGGGIAATHNDASIVGAYLTAQQVNQIVAEILAMQTAFNNPNLVLNSDFGRRTVFGLAMPEVFADTAGYVKVDAGTAPTVSANVLTFGAANNNLAWCNQSFGWRDGRASATFKAVATAGFYSLKWRVDASNDINVQMNAGNFLIQKVIGGTPTTVATVAQALTLNRWYFLEIEKQGTTIIGKLWDTTVTTPGTLKSASTLLQTLTGTVSDAGVQVGAHVGITSDQATAQWGGIATGNGGVYVETWLPETFGGNLTFGGTLGGQAIGLDESADSGPLAKQWALRMYIPAASRSITMTQNSPDGSVAPSTAFTHSLYMKVGGKGGSGVLGSVLDSYLVSAGTGSGTSVTLSDAGETSWTRKTGTATSDSTTRRVQFAILANAALTATGTVYFQLAQIEQGSAATAWRNAPEEAASIVYPLKQTANAAILTTATSFGEIDSRDLAANIFCPYDCTLVITLTGQWQNSASTNYNVLDVTVDGTTLGGTDGITVLAQQARIDMSNFATTITSRVAAGKHRVAARWRVTAGTGTMGATAQPTLMTIVASRGK